MYKVIALSTFKEGSEHVPPFYLNRKTSDDDSNRSIGIYLCNTCKASQLRKRRKRREGVQWLLLSICACVYLNLHIAYYYYLYIRYVLTVYMQSFMFSKFLVISIL